MISGRLLNDCGGRDVEEPGGLEASQFSEAPAKVLQKLLPIQDIGEDTPTLIPQGMT